MAATAVAANVFDPAKAASLGALARRAAAEDTALDLAGLLWLEHINIVVGDRALGDYFYFDVLGCTRDANGKDANIGQQQFHISGADAASPQAIYGSIGLAMPGLAELTQVRVAAPTFRCNRQSMRYAVRHRR